MKFKYMPLALLPLYIASCSEEETFAPVTSQQEVLVTAGVGTHSRMVLSDQGEYTKSFWQNGDEISLFTTTQSNLVYNTTIDANSATASFSPNIMANQTERLQYIEGNTVYACYPNTTATTESNLIVNLPSTKEIDYNNGKLKSFCYAVDSIANGKLNFKFKHLSAFLCLTVTPEMVPVGNSINVTVSTSSNAPLSIGEGDTFDFSTLTATTTHGTNSVKIDTAHSNDSIWTIYIPVLPQPANEDITITVTNSHDELLYTITKATPTSGFQAGNVYKVDTTTSYDVAYLVDGPTFNTSIKQLVSGGSSDDYLIGRIQFLTDSINLPSNYITVSAEGSQAPIYAYFNQEDSLLTISTTAKRMEIIDASNMFYHLSSLHTINFGNFKINEKTTNMSQMFSCCSSLKSLDIADWNTENVTDMGGVFSVCESLKTIDIATWNTKNVTNMNRMFWCCSSLDTLDVANWNTANVVNMEGLFGHTSLTTLNVANWNTNKVTDMSVMFQGCSSLTTLDVANWNTNNVINMAAMFSWCPSLETLNIANWNTANVTNMWEMFYGCQSLYMLNINNWTFNQNVYIEVMFHNCAYDSQACKIIASTEAKEFLLNQTLYTFMTPEWFIWEDADNNEDSNENEEVNNENVQW